MRVVQIAPCITQSDSTDTSPFQIESLFMPSIPLRGFPGPALRDLPPPSGWHYMACISRVWVSCPDYTWKHNGGTIRTNIQSEGDVEGVMDRPIGNTPEVHAECEKWYV